MVAGAAADVAFQSLSNLDLCRVRAFGFHPLLAFLDRPEIAGGQGLAGLLGQGQRRV